MKRACVRPERTVSPLAIPRASPSYGLVCRFGIGAALLVLGLGLAGLSARSAGAQSSEAALVAVRAAVNAELNAAKTDHSAWCYRDHDVQPDKDEISEVIETPKGNISRLVSLNGHRLTGSDETDELKRIQDYVNSPEAQERKRRDAAHDDAQARELLTMLPNAFTWTITGQDAAEIRLTFHPNPDFKPNDMQARVLGIMSGEMVIARNGDRIRTLRGTLTDDVRIGFGILGKLDKGGTFNVERREIAPGHWQITETHVHIGGRAMLFKSIGQQEDETKTDFRPSTAANLQIAEEQIQHL